MEQIYNRETASIYNEIWGQYALNFGTSVIHYLREAPIAAKESALAVDLACGTGNLAQMLCDAGFSVLGIDISPQMLAHAERRCADYVARGSAQFKVGNMVSFSTADRQASLVTCSYDSINHLESESDLSACFNRVAAVMRPDGYFVFDINTARGLQDWDRIKITERPDYVTFSRGFFDPAAGRAWKKFLGI
jgi:SAM-dependent methyltransferase